MLSILGLVAVIVTTYFAYKTAKDTGRNAILWALITFAVGVGFQIIIPMLIGIFVAVAWMASGSTVEEVQTSLDSISWIIGIICLFLSFLGIGLIMRHLSKIPEEKSFISPPSPPSFGE